ncbi:MAG: aspartate--tRNA ligase [Alphaproteobacteria bacterium]
MDNFSSHYRTHTCSELSMSHTNKKVKLAGWVHRKRDHGDLLFIDIRDHYGIIQCVIEKSMECFQIADKLRLESVIEIDGVVVKRAEENVNSNIGTGEIEVKITEISILSDAEILPMSVNQNADFPESTRLSYRFLDLRRHKMHQNIILRSNIISFIRERMIRDGFLEIQTPILTASSPEGARDYLVPSRLHPGRFYALPQAPQQFKQLLMASGFDRYFQIAPCFRDEDARADRSPGEFYQLDFEMAFVDQEDVFNAIEPVMYDLFKEFAKNSKITSLPFPKIPYDKALELYGSDKPDLRNPLIISDVTDVFKDSNVLIFANAIKEGALTKAIVVSDKENKPRSFYDQLNTWAREELELPGLAYVILESQNIKGPIAKFFDENLSKTLSQKLNLKDGDTVFFVCAHKAKINALSGQIRNHLGNVFNLVDQNSFKFCWVVDFPMYEKDEETGKTVFFHNPFSMPQGGMESLIEKDPLTIKAYQYDIVCNGIELSSGAIRNHKPDVMVKAFEIAGYNKHDVEEKFGSLFRAFHYGAPPHGGCAPGIDRIVMLLAKEPNLREVVAFPFNQQAEDLLMGAPSPIDNERLKELHIQTKLPKGAKL